MRRDTLIDASVFREWIVNVGRRDARERISHLLCEIYMRLNAVGLVVAVAGLVLDTQSEVVSDVRELVPQDLQALRDVNELQAETGVAGEIDVTVRGQRRVPRLRRAGRPRLGNHRRRRSGHDRHGHRKRAY